MLAKIVGSREDIAAELLISFPELGQVRLRRGGLPPRIGGWCLLRARVAGITVGRTVWLAHGEAATGELLLHEARHVYQFQAVRWFAVKYVWESLRRGYHDNGFEHDARQYAAARMQGSAISTYGE